MTRTARFAIATVVLATAGVVSWSWLRRTADATAGIPTVLLERREFVRQVTAEGRLVPVKATPILVPMTDQGPLKIGWIIEDGAAVKKGDVVVRFDPTELERQLRDGQDDLATARARGAKERIEADGNERGRDTSSTLAQKELAATRAFASRDPAIFSKNQIVESEIDEGLSRARVAHADDASQIERRVSRSKAALIDVERQKAELTVSQAKKGLTSLEVTAPHDGIVVLDRDWSGETSRVGQQAWPGHDLAEIPILADMMAEVFVLEADGGGLEEGQQATVIVESHGSVAYEATVKSVDKLAKPRQRGVPVQYFAVKLSLARTVPEVMKPGQRVRATLILDRDEAIVVPRQAVFERDGKTVAYRLGAGGFDPVVIELGSSTAGRVVVTKGLEAGDRIALRDPMRASDEPAAAATPDEPAAGGEPP